MISWRKFNKEEVAVGALFGLAFVGVLKGWIIITIPVCAYLWALGGAEGTNLLWRRIGVPLCLGVFAATMGPGLRHLISIGLMFSATTLGYGIPSENDNDPGSPLGKFMYYGWAKKDKVKADQYTRGTWALAFGCAALPMCWGHPLAWIFGTMLLMVLYPVIVRKV